MGVLEVAVRILGVREVVFAEFEGVSIFGSCGANLVIPQLPGGLEVLLIVVTGEFVIETISNEAIRPGLTSWVGLCALGGIMIVDFNVCDLPETRLPSSPRYRGAVSEVCPPCCEYHSRDI
jgi:hypothetical protein